MYVSITLHQFKKEAITDLAKHIIKIYYSAPVTKDNAREWTDHFFTSHSPNDIAKIMTDNTYYVKCDELGNYFNYEEFIQELAQYILYNMSEIVNKTYSELIHSL